MDIVSAIHRINDGKKVRRTAWLPGEYWERRGTRVYEHGGPMVQQAEVFIKDMLADDWEIAE